LDGLLKGGDLRLRGWGLCRWVGDCRGNSHREMARKQEEEQQLQRATGHEIFRFEFSSARLREGLLVLNDRLWRA
jgi:hypothetical protein